MDSTQLHKMAQRDLQIAFMQGQLREGIKASATSFIGILGVAHGGTGLPSAPIGTMLYASAANVYSSVTLGPNLAVTASVLDVVGGALIQGTNQSGVTVKAGQAVVATAAGDGFTLAQANSMATLADGLCTADCLSGATMTVQTAGPITLADWTDVIGAASLTVRGRYFLSPVTAGRLQIAPVTGAGNFWQRIGVAVTATKLIITREGKSKL